MGHRGWGVIGLLMTLQGCANLAPLPPLPPPPDASLSVVGPKGKPLPDGSRERIERAIEAQDDGSLRRHLATMEAVSGSPLITGNRVRLLVDGPAAYGAMFDAIAAARSEVLIEMFIFEEAHHAGQDLSALLLQKVRGGVPVGVLYDSVGSRTTPKEFLAKLADAGVVLCEFNPIAPGRVRGKTAFSHRDHRKVVVVDGAVAFAGGINFSGTYSSGSRKRRARAAEAIKDGWRDTNVEVRGPAVAPMRELFESTWTGQRCAARKPPARPLPEPAAAGSTLLRLDASSPASTRNETYLAAVSSLQAAQESIDITMAYFSPDAQIERALTDAAARGVRVRLLLPGLLDFGGILHAGRAHYARLMAAGIEIYEEPRALLHAKTLSIDGVLSTVGSANWDYLSFALNDELNVVVVDREFGARMREVFENDLAQAVRIDPEEWKRRPLGQKLRQRFWLTWERLL